MKTGVRKNKWKLVLEKKMKTGVGKKKMKTGLGKNKQKVV